MLLKISNLEKSDADIYYYTSRAPDSPAQGIYTRLKISNVEIIPVNLRWLNEKYEDPCRYLGTTRHWSSEKTFYFDTPEFADHPDDQWCQSGGFQSSLPCILRLLKKKRKKNKINWHDRFLCHFLPLCVARASNVDFSSCKKPVLPLLYCFLLSDIARYRDLVTPTQDIMLTNMNKPLSTIIKHAWSGFCYVFRLCFAYTIN